MRRKPPSIAVVALLISAPSGLALAQVGGDVPAACRTQLGQRAFTAGHTAGGSLARQAWNNVKDCDHVEDFESLVMNTLSRYGLPSNPSDYTACRYTGMVTGIIDELDGLFNVCTDQCFAEGEIAGDISAIAYCELSIALGGLASADDFIRGPVQVCGMSFELGCDTMFDTTSESYSNKIGACLAYTRDPFTSVWHQARSNQCAYNPLLRNPTEQPQDEVRAPNGP